MTHSAPGSPSAWRYSDSGAGSPLILLHGLGMSRAVWTPVIPYMITRRRVIAFDIAGFGETPPLCEVPPTIGNLVDALASTLRHIGLSNPVDMAGNSLGACLALEAARRGLARSVVAIAPSGLWKAGPPLHVPCVFRSLRFAATRGSRPLKALLRVAAIRELALAVPLSTGSRRMPAEAACRAVDDLRRSPAFEATFEHTRTPFSGPDIAVPVTVVFGSRDWILRSGSRRRSQLPAHARWIEKRGWGHVPMWVDPAGVSEVILGGVTEDERAARFDASDRWTRV